jgi:type IV pilus assembly protein PilY1
MTTLALGLKKISAASSLALLLAFLGQTNAWSAPLNLADSPLFALNTVEPNVILTLDDSGSMAWAYLPDDISGLGGTRRFCSSEINQMYYNPAIVYSPGVDQAGTLMTDASFTAARINPYNAADANVVNLSTSYRPVLDVENSNTTVPFNNSYASCNTAPLNTAQPAFYYTYTPSLAGTGGCPNPAVNTNDACYVYVAVSASSGPGGTDERTNFANWYTYYRARMLAAKSAVGRTFSSLGEDFRLAYQRINTCNAGLGVAATGTCPGTYVRKFTGAQRTSFFTWLLSSPMNNSTPLVQAAEDVRAYMQGTNVYSPWAENPGTSVGTEHSCRQNFSIIMTDGIWNGGAVGANVDNSTFTLPDGTTYSPGGLPANRRIYPDTNTGFLADVVFNTWRTDARTLNNNVPAHIGDSTGTAAEVYFNPVNNPATWQHAATYTIGLGLTGLLDPATDYNALLNGTLDWNGGDHVDDLWHAAVNGRGQYFSARNPNQLVDAITATLNQIQARVGSGAGLAANGGSSGSDTYLYQVKFNTSNWTGRLLALALDPVTGAPSATPAWDAAVKLNSQQWDTGRNIFTFKPSTNDGVRFRWADLDPAQQDALDRNPGNVDDNNGAARLNYLRGDSTNEGAGLNFRVRSCTDINGTPITCPANMGKLGDIIDSSAVYVGKPPYNYPATLESSSYQTFADNNASRKPMVYAGANDGMLHGFNATFPTTAASGREEMAYVPNLVYSNISTNNLSLLSWPNYTHRYYVDGTPTVGDVYYDGNWHTVLVGGLRKGGKGYYALDITDPSNFTENAANASSLALWEFTDPDLGFSYSQATIIKMANGPNGKGKWAAVFGNGYNNTGSGHAVLFIVDIETGALIAKLDTSVSGGGGDATTPNGMATPAVVDINRDHIADYIYAGDLQGKMWRFDVRSSTSTDWALPANISAIFTATDPVGGAVQTITERPAIGFHPLGYGGLMVYFGTGKYLESSDNTTTGTAQTQTFYAIYDRGVTAYTGTSSAPVSIARSDLLQQTITTAATVGGFDTRVVTDNTINWRLTQTATAGTHLGWYVNLPTNGEKQVTDPLLREGRIIFTTLIPSIDPCQVGGSGWLMELNANNGGRLEDTFDFNGDGLFTSADRPGGGTISAAGAQLTGGGGALSTPVVLTSPPASTRPPIAGSAACKETKYSQGTGGTILQLAETCTPFDVRQAWRQRK